MEFIKIEKEYTDIVTNIAYQSYLIEHNKNQGVPICSKESLKTRIEDAMPNMNGYVYKEQGEVIGYLIYFFDKQDPNLNWCWILVWGYGAIGDNREKILSRLFQKIAEDLCKNVKVHFEVRLYAHDETIIRLFSFLQFGIESEEGICFTHDEIKSKANVQIYELNKHEVEQRWSEIWDVLSRLIHHLQKSPVFYPSTEFTQELYKEFFMDPDTYVYVAMQDNSIIGLIEVNKEQGRFVDESEQCYNTGEVYVIDEYRGRGIAQALLQRVKESMKSQGVNYLWVEHGTANPNARGFWNKYFDTYYYTMVRDIDGNI